MFQRDGTFIIYGDLDRVCNFITLKTKNNEKE